MQSIARACAASVISLNSIKQSGKVVGFAPFTHMRTHLYNDFTDILSFASIFLYIFIFVALIFASSFMFSMLLL